MVMNGKKKGVGQVLLRKIAALADNIAHACPRWYLVLLTCLALCGYACILLFPVLTLVGAGILYDGFFGQGEVAGDGLMVWLLVVLLSAITSYRLIRMRLPLPVGGRLTAVTSPRLFGLVRELVSHYKRPGIDRIIVSGQYRLDVVKTPVWFLPVWSKNTLVIGLPVLQSLSPRSFRCAVARRLGQFSRKGNMLGNWLYQLQDVWWQYLGAFSSGKGIAYQPLRLLFSVYAPLYDAVSAPAMCRDELAADRYALETNDDWDLLEMICAEAVTRIFLERKYWPSIRHRVQLDPKTVPMPYSRMTPVLRARLYHGDLDRWLGMATQPEARGDRSVPALRERIENIGHMKCVLPRMPEKAAAGYFLGAGCKGIVSETDRRWYQSVINRKKRAGKRSGLQGAGSLLARMVRSLKKQHQDLCYEQLSSSLCSTIMR